MAKKQSRKVITRAAVRRAFAGTLRTPQALDQAMDEYLGNSPVPPAWSLRSVRGAFGRRLAREWARHLRHLRPASFRAESGRHVAPVVQTLYDFNAVESALACAGTDNSASIPTLVPDEAHYWLEPIAPCSEPRERDA